METTSEIALYDFYIHQKKQGNNGTHLNNVKADKILMVKDKVCDIYSINLNITPFHIIKDVLQGCEEVENECWNAQEDFQDYAAKSDFLYYAQRDGQVLAFFLVSYFIIDRCCVISMDEIMVRKSEQKQKLGIKLATIAFRDFDNIESGNKKFKSISLLSITPNKKMMNSYAKGSLLTNLNLFDSTFNASDELEAIHRKYLSRVGYKLVQETHPFFIKNVFPGSSKTAVSCQYHDKLKAILPDGFDPLERGDSLCFMLKVNRFLYSLSCFLYMQKIFGLRFWMRKRLGIWPFKKKVY